MDGHNMVSCLRISTCHHNLVYMKADHALPFGFFGSMLPSTQYSYKRLLALRFSDSNFFMNFFPAMHAACSFHLILLDLIALGLTICEESKLRNFSVCRFILRRLGIFFKRLSSKINPRKGIAHNSNFQEYPSTTEY